MRNLISKMCHTNNLASYTLDDDDDAGAFFDEILIAPFEYGVNLVLYKISRAV